MKKIIGMLLACLLTGCALMISETQVGDKTLKIHAEDWDGVWSCENDILVVKTIDGGAGKLKVAMIQAKGDDFKITTGEVVLKSLGKDQFINIPFADIAEKKELKEKYAKYFLWAKFQRQDDNLIVWIADANFLKTLIQSKKLAGRVEEDNIIITDSAEKLNEVISKNIDKVINWQHPGVYNRIKPMD